MRLHHLVLLITFTILSTSPSNAWDPIEGPESCIIGESWELGHIVIVNKRIDGDEEDLMSDDIYIAITNDDWSLSSTDTVNFPLKFQAEDGSWLSNTPIAIDHGLLMTTELKYLENFNFVSSMQVFKGREKIATLNWSGFFTALNKLKRCVEKARAPIVERRRLEEVRKANPRDPFEKPVPNSE